MFLYIESLFAEVREREVRPLHSIPDTLGQLYLLAMREHRRKAVVQHRVEDRWLPTPDWRLDRHVIRIALYMDERLGIEPGDRLAVVSELRPEWIVADLAVMGLGATSVSVPVGAPPDVQATALAEFRPRGLFLSGAAWRALEPRLELFSELEGIFLFDAVAVGERAILYSEALDLGGTLDTPERAAAFRDRVREIEPTRSALRHYELSADGGWSFTELSQGGVIQRLEPLWLEHPACEGDRVYLAGGDVTLAERLALYAHIGDGYSTTFLGTPGRELEEVIELRPERVAAPREVLATIAAARAGGRDGKRPQRRLARLLSIFGGRGRVAAASGAAALRDRIARPGGTAGGREDRAGRHQ